MPDTSRDPDEILPEYDLTGSRPSPYAARYAEGTNLVRLDEDVAKAFPTAESVNEALRALAAIIEKQQQARSAA